MKTGAPRTPTMKKIIERIHANTFLQKNDGVEQALSHMNTELLQVGSVLHLANAARRSQKSLGRHAAPVHAGPAHVVAIEDSNLEACVRARRAGCSLDIGRASPSRRWPLAMPTRGRRRRVRLEPRSEGALIRTLLDRVERAAVPADTAANDQQVIIVLRASSDDAHGGRRARAAGDSNAVRRKSERAGRVQARKGHEARSRHDCRAPRKRTAAGGPGGRAGGEPLRQRPTPWSGDGQPGRPRGNAAPRRWPSRAQPRRQRSASLLCRE